MLSEWSGRGDGPKARVGGERLEATEETEFHTETRREREIPGVVTNPGGLNELTSRIIGCAILVHREIGPGLLESVYGRCLLIELNAQGLHTVSGRASV